MNRERAKEMLTERNSVGDYWSHEFIIDMIYDSFETKTCKNCSLLELPCPIAQVLFYDLGFGLEEIGCPKFKSLGESK